MDRCLIVVARDRPDLFQHLSEHQTPDLQVILDRRVIARTPRTTAQTNSGGWRTTLERDGFVAVAAQ